VRIGLFIASPRIEDFVSDARSAKEAGFAGVWAPQIFAFDALTSIAVAGREVAGVEFGTAVVPTFPRHPSALALQALSTQDATGGRLTLGIGLSHQVVVENMWGLSFDKPVRHMREYLSVLLPLLRDKAVSFSGETIKTMAQIQMDVPAPPVLIAALGPKMLRLAGSVADGTITWMTGPKTVGAHIVPSITAAANHAGRPSPRVVACIPIAVTDDEAAARERCATAFSIYNGLPSYRAMLDREGAGGPADIAIVGNEASVRAQIEDVFTQGATDYVAVPFHERERTIGAVAGLARS
jgi:5,10-methylenetetrahydromethanopterin reductase